MDGNNVPESTPKQNMKMIDHLTDNQIEAFRHSRLDGAQLLQVSDHLAACNLCRERAIASGVLSVKIAHLQEDFERHLSDEELMSWADARPVDEPGFVEAHLERCASCRQELADLHAFQSRLKPQPPARLSFQWAALAAALIVIVALLVARKQPAPVSLPVASVRPAVIDRAPILDALYRPEGKLLGNAAQTAFRALSPVGIVTGSDRPVFRWEDVPGATGYVVAVYDSNFRKVAESPKLTANQWETAEPLMRGMSFSWQVIARAGGKELIIPSPPARQAVFQVLNAESAAEIARARDIDHVPPIALGLLYARAGALEDAEAELRKAPEAKELLESVQKLLQHQR